MSQHQLAKSIDVDSRCVHALVNGKESVTAEMALRLSRFFGTSARFWTGLQSQYDLEVTKDRIATELSLVKRLKANGIDLEAESPSIQSLIRISRREVLNHLISVGTYFGRPTLLPYRQQFMV